jgi:hypothetical protein
MGNSLGGKSVRDSAAAGGATPGGITTAVLIPVRGRKQNPVRKGRAADVTIITGQTKADVHTKAAGGIPARASRNAVLEAGGETALNRDGGVPIMNGADEARRKAVRHPVKENQITVPRRRSRLKKDCLQN